MVVGLLPAMTGWRDGTKEWCKWKWSIILPCLVWSHDVGSALLSALRTFHGDFLKVRYGQVQVKRSEESFTTIFRHWDQNSPSDFQLEVLQKPGSKHIGGFDLCALTSHAAVNPWQPEVIFSLLSPKRPLGSMLPFSQLLHRGLVSFRCLCPSCYRFHTSLHFLVSLWQRRDQSLGGCFYSQSHSANCWWYRRGNPSSKWGGPAEAALSLNGLTPIITPLDNEHYIYLCVTKDPNSYCL